jgi:tRNA A-37 threonylcarbamoyl transferase component Bud32
MADNGRGGFEGRTVGRFRLVRLLGEGGTSSVYLGERTGDFLQIAAVKLLREDACDAAMSWRFRAERQVLAALQHPNIVQLIGGGVTQDGVPYLVMEYVEGQPLDQYCDERRLSVAERIRLVIQVLDAIEYAHQRFVAHCDLKPSNILVSGEDQPRLLDFGITKLLEPSRLGLEMQATRAADRPFTLEFASPEQLRGEKLTTATDIYSSGVVLYFLLTGSHPFERVRDEPLALRQATISSEPEAPSHRMANLARADRAAAERIAGLRGTTPAQLARELRGEIDSVLLKALRKERELRYASAAEFAADLRNWLAGRPVEARRGSRRYRAWKFIKRNRAGVAAASILAAVLLAGAAGAAWQGIRVQQSRAIAEARLEDARKLTSSLLVDFYASVQKLEGSESAKRLLVRWSRETLDNLAKQSGSNAAVRIDLANTYLQLGRLQATEGDPVPRWSDAILSFDRGLALLEPVLRAENRNRPARLARVNLLIARSQAEAAAGRMHDSARDAELARKLLEDAGAK